MEEDGDGDDDGDCDDGGDGELDRLEFLSVD